MRVVTLEKHIPMQAGLGGGSSDAAAALLGLRRLWKLRVPDDELHAMAARLGSDVPYLSRRRHGARARPWRGGVSARGPAALVGGAGHSAVRRRDGRRVSVAGRAARAEPRVRTSAAGYLPGTWLGRIVPARQRPRPPVIERHPVDRHAERAAAEAGRGDGRHVGQRLDGLRRLHDGAGGRSRAARAFAQNRAPTIARLLPGSAEPLSRSGRPELARKSFNRIKSSFALRWSSPRLEAQLSALSTD